jgi:hypothetical protein
MTMDLQPRSGLKKAWTKGGDGVVRRIHPRRTIGGRKLESDVTNDEMDPPEANDRREEVEMDV